jgi:hypothetical protein
MSLDLLGNFLNEQVYTIPQEVINDRFALPHFGSKVQTSKVSIIATLSIYLLFSKY